MMHIKKEHCETAIIKKTLVDTTNNLYKTFVNERNKWKFKDDYVYVPPIQYTDFSIKRNDLSITLLQEY